MFPFNNGRNSSLPQSYPADQYCLFTPAHDQQIFSKNESTFSFPELSPALDFYGSNQFLGNKQQVYSYAHLMNCTNLLCSASNELTAATADQAKALANKRAAGASNRVLSEDMDVVSSGKCNLVSSRAAARSSSGVGRSISSSRSKNRERHSKICTAQGVRDRRMRLSVEVARRFFNLQDMLGFDKASKTIDWLMKESEESIQEVARVHSNAGDCCSAESENVSGIIYTAAELDREEEGLKKKKSAEADEKMKRVRAKDAIICPASKESRAPAAPGREKSREKMSSNMLGALEDQKSPLGSVEESSCSHNGAASYEKRWSLKLGMESIDPSELGLSIFDQYQQNMASSQSEVARGSGFFNDYAMTNFMPDNWEIGGTRSNSNLPNMHLCKGL